MVRECNLTTIIIIIRIIIFLHEKLLYKDGYFYFNVDINKNVNKIE
jgi:hypothetical protein